MNLLPPLRPYKTHLRLIFVSVLGLVGTLLPASAANYYVDYASGSDANAGTSNTAAWKHAPGDPAATGSAAVVALGAGDTVFFKGGVSYVFTGSTGIALRWSGVQGSPITYDGNSAGTWGAGRAKFTDNYSASAMNAFASSGPVGYLAFKNLEIGAIGGSTTLPADTGSPVAPKFGGGIAFGAALTNVQIENCFFHDLGYAFNTRPMSAASLAGAGITVAGGDGLTVTGTQFSRMAVGLEATAATSLSNFKITNCTFGESVVWPLNLPATVSATSVAVTGTSETNNSQFDRGAWTGYGDSPRTFSRVATAGSAVTFTASAIADPAPTFQWRKDGVAISGATLATLTLSSVASGDAGIYTVVASNSGGSSLSHEMVLTVQSTSSDGTTISTPTITTQPISTTAAPLSTATFTVAASGSPAPTFQWFRNGTSYAGWTGSTLTLPGVTINDAGNYWVVATNSAGSVTSNTATLTIDSNATSTAVSPAITTQPVSQTVAATSTVTFTVAASGTPTPTYQWFRNGVTAAGWTGASLVLSNVTTDQAGNYTAVATNSAGTATSNVATLTVTTSSSTTTGAPVFSVQPASQTVKPLATVTFSALASGSPTYTWFRNGTTFSGWTGSTLTLSGVTENDAANYTVVATNSNGSTTSNVATLTVSDTATTTPPPSTTSAPIFTTQPQSQTAAEKSTVTFTASASGSPTPTYQWFRNGTAVSSGTASTLTLRSLSLSDAGNYTAVATNSAGTATSNVATLTVVAGSKGRKAYSGVEAMMAPTQTDSRLVNLSVRSTAGEGNQSLIVGFVVGGTSDKSLLIRGSGPALAEFGVPGVLSDPKLSVYSGSALLAANDDWSASADVEAIAPASAQLGAFALAPASRDAALITAVVPGAYTGQLSGKDAASGTALIELYDNAAGSSSRLVNVAVRTVVKSGSEAPVIGFVVAGTEPKKLLIRAVGPSLAEFGVENPLADPRVELYEGPVRLMENDNWATMEELEEVFTHVGAFPLAGRDSKDAALLVVAPPGAYTAVISGAGNTTGTVLLEVYEVQ